MAILKDVRVTAAIRKFPSYRGSTTDRREELDSLTPGASATGHRPQDQPSNNSLSQSQHALNSNEGGSDDETDDMDNTQPSTQPVFDPRRLGLNGSGLTDRDLADVICILHPNSQAAIEAVNQIAETAPQHILQNADLRRGHGDDDAGDGHRSKGNGKVRDIALRISSKLKDQCMGFVFGRNTAVCDIGPGTTDPSRRVSNRHFRIWVTKDEVLMLQDMSTNGTYVDSCLLRQHPMIDNPKVMEGQRGEFGNQRMLVSGSIIQLISFVGEKEEIKFLVRIPNRENFEDAYLENLHLWLDDIAEEQHRRADEYTRLRTAGVPTFQPAPAALFQAPPRLLEGPDSRPYRSAASWRPGRAKAWNGGGKYNIIGAAGKGAFATVYKIATKRDGDVFAAKELSKRHLMKSGIFDKKLDNEMQIMKRLHHRHIVEYIEHVQERDQMYIIMEFVPGGDLGTIISDKGPLPEATVKRMAYQVLQALEYLHQCKITHRDIKPDNILIVTEDPIEVKLSDFGLSKVIENPETFLKTFCGTLLYCAPEVFSKFPEYIKDQPRRRRKDPQKAHPHSYNQACDIWSFAAVLFMALTGRPPFSVETGDKDLMLEKIMTTELEVMPLIEHHVSPRGIDFIRRLLNPRPECRPTDSECLEDPWLADLSGRKASNDDAVKDEMLEGDAGLDASQLSLDDKKHPNSDDEDELDLDMPLKTPVRPLKRLRPDAFAPRDPPEHPSSPDEVSYSNLPVADSDTSYGFMRNPPNPNRLFGEIGHSALVSSGVMPSGNMNVGLDGMTESFGGQAATAVNAGQPLTTNTSGRTLAEFTQYPVNAPQNGDPAASLYGAEVLVGRLHMASPSSAHSRASTPKTPLSPKTPHTRDHSPWEPTEQSSDNDEVQEDAQVAAPEPPKFVRRINIPIPDSYYYDAWDRSTHNAEYAAKMRAQEAISGRSGSTSRRGSRKGSGDDQTSGEGLPGTVSDADAPKTVSGTRSTFVSSKGKEKASHAAVNFPHPPSMPNPSTAVVPHPDSEFARPLPIYGKLTSTAKSIQPISIPLHERETSWGRGAGNTFIHPNGQDARIPKYALDIVFWKEGRTDELASTSASPDPPTSDQSWTDMADVWAVLKTRTSRKIWINGVPLVARQTDPTTGQPRIPFGKLYSGDVITVFREGGAELRFLCEFWHGRSAGRRPVGGKRFEVLFVDVDVDGDGGGEGKGK
ncbi:MAG: hypothetical protein M1817_000720 [Caeruleum heppii]|nr:MAG: hypothetical protein M1817_000720 [Caeruleum heppii]